MEVGTISQIQKTTTTATKEAYLKAQRQVGLVLVNLDSEQGGLSTYGERECLSITEYLVGDLNAVRVIVHSNGRRIEARPDLDDEAVSGAGHAAGDVGAVRGRGAAARHVVPAQGQDGQGHYWHDIAGGGEGGVPWDNVGRGLGGAVGTL